MQYYYFGVVDQDKNDSSIEERRGWSVPLYLVHFLTLIIFARKEIVVARRWLFILTILVCLYEFGMY